MAVCWCADVQAGQGVGERVHEAGAGRGRLFAVCAQPLPSPGALLAATHALPPTSRARPRPPTCPPNHPPALPHLPPRRINGLTHINLTKLDVLSDLAEIKVGVAYRTPSGALLHTVPEDLDLLEQCEVGARVVGSVVVVGSGVV